MREPAAPRCEGTDEGRQCFGPGIPEVGEDQADLVAATAESRVEGTAELVLERASDEAAAWLHVRDHWRDGAETS